VENSRNTLRIHCAVIREVLRGERFTDIADLSEAVKGRCGKLKIHYDGAQIAAALREVWRMNGGQVLAEPGPTPSRTDDEPTPFSRDEAGKLLEQLGVKPLGGMR
jgi:hypothetical protein